MKDRNKSWWNDCSSMDKSGNHNHWYDVSYAFHVHELSCIYSLFYLNMISIEFLTHSLLIQELGYSNLIHFQKVLSLLFTKKLYIFKRSKLFITVQVSQICFIRITTSVDLVETWKESSYYNSFSHFHFPKPYYLFVYL